jgi:SAM-dependent methyltransferase
MPIDSHEAGSADAERTIRLATERVERCPLCETSAAKTWRTDCRDWQQPLAADRFEYRRCTTCGARFLGDRPVESELGKVYFEGYGPYQAEPTSAAPLPSSSLVARAAAPPLHALGAGVGLPATRRLARQLKRMYTPEAADATLLDYGCGTPTFLDRARESGFVTVGADFDEEVVRAVRASGHEGFLVGDELARGVPDGSVTCVRMNHVIEHLYRPREVLAEIRRKLLSGGRIHLSTPNPSSFGSLLFRNRWHALDCPRHVVLYRPPVLRGLLRELGFRDISVVNEVGPKDLTRSWGIAQYDRGRIRHEQIQTMAADPIRSGIFLPLASVAALFSLADRYHVFARS